MAKISIYTDYITLGQFLKISSLISSGGQAKFFLEINAVFVNGIEEKRRGKKLFPGDFVEFNGTKYAIVSEKWYWKKSLFPILDVLIK